VDYSAILTFWWNSKKMQPRLRFANFTASIRICTGYGLALVKDDPTMRDDEKMENILVGAFQRHDAAPEE
jgi:hypothetical protein